jgi:hypothetical protein
MLLKDDDQRRIPNISGHLVTGVGSLRQGGLAHVPFWLKAMWRYLAFRKVLITNQPVGNMSQYWFLHEYHQRIASLSFFLRSVPIFLKQKNSLLV